MGNDWKLFNATTGRMVASLYRCCSGNFRDIWKTYNFNINVLHGHTGAVVIHYLSNIISNMLSDGHILLSRNYVDSLRSHNPDWMWGHKDGVRLPDSERTQAVLYQLKMYLDLALEFPNARWIGDQTYYEGDYNLNGKEISGVSLSFVTPDSDED
jgi:hypothetical protein